MKITTITLLALIFSFITPCLAIKSFEITNLINSAKQGDIISQFSLGCIYLNGGKEIKQNIPEGIKWLKKSGEQGDAGSFFILGAVYMKGGNGVSVNTNIAWQYIKKAAKLDHWDAQLLLATGYFLGNMGLPKDLNKTILWLTKAADNGNVKAQAMLGELYRNPPSPEFKNISLAIKYLKKAAEQDDAESQAKLSWHYEKGKGIIKDQIKALEWLRRAALTGENPIFANRLAMFCDKGMIIEVNHAMAYAWATIAAGKGMPQVRNLFDKKYTLEERLQGLGYAKILIKESISIRGNAMKSSEKRHSPHHEFLIKKIIKK